MVRRLLLAVEKVGFASPVQLWRLPAAGERGEPIFQAAVEK